MKRTNCRHSWDRYRCDKVSIGDAPLTDCDTFISICSKCGAVCHHQDRDVPVLCLPTEPVEILAVGVNVAAQMISVSASTLNQRRKTGKDCPPFYYEGTAILYPVAGLKAHVESRPTFTSTTAAELYDQMQKKAKG